MSGKATAAAMRAASLIEPHDDNFDSNFCLALSRDGECNCTRPNRVQSTAEVIDRETGLSALFDLLRRADLHLAAEGWLEETPGAGYLLRDIRAALAKVSA